MGTDLNSNETELTALQFDEENVNQDIKTLKNAIGKNKALAQENLEEIFTIFHRIADVSKSRKKLNPLSSTIPENQQEFIEDIVARIGPAVFLDQNWEDLPREQFDLFRKHFKDIRDACCKNIHSWLKSQQVQERLSSTQREALNKVNYQVRLFTRRLQEDLTWVIKDRKRVEVGEKGVMKAELIACTALQATHELLQNPTEDQLKAYNATAETFSDVGQERTGDLMLLAGLAVMAAAVIGAIILPASIGPAILLGSLGLFAAGAALSFAGLVRAKKVEFSNEAADKMNKFSNQAGESLISMGKSQ